MFKSKKQLKRELEETKAEKQKIEEKYIQLYNKFNEICDLREKQQREIENQLKYIWMHSEVER